MTVRRGFLYRDGRLLREIDEGERQPLPHDVDMLLNCTQRFALDDQGMPMLQIAPFGHLIIAARLIR